MQAVSFAAHRGGSTSKTMAVLEDFLKRWAECAVACHVSESSWDPKANCVVHLMNSALAEEALLQLREIFPQLWSRRDSEHLPDDISPIVNNFGGFQDGQFVAATEPMDGVRAWAWWSPWADDVTVSIRVGLLGDVTDAQLLTLRSVLNGLRPSDPKLRLSE
jgi:hypothetical protein